ncbi:iron-regulated transporter [Cryomyces antarcticus]
MEATEVPLLPLSSSVAEPLRSSEEQPKVSLGTTRRLYVSHFLSTWNSRVFEFVAVLFLASIYPSTLLPVSVYALIRAASAVILSPAIGHYIDNSERLSAVRLSIIGQRLAVAASCVVFYLLSTSAAISPIITSVALGVLAILACVEKLCSIMNLIAVERDWVVVIAHGNESYLQELNSQMRRIDLFCKLVGPLVVSLIDGISTKIAILVVLGSNAVLVIVEYYAIARVYQQVPLLQKPHASPRREVSLLSIAPSASIGRIRSVAVWTQEACKPLISYLNNPLVLPSMSLSLLYFTVLSFAGSMMTYLLSTGITSTQLGIVRTVSIAVEISATWIAPRVMNRIGPTRGGIWFITWQMVCLAVAVACFWSATTPRIAATGLIAGVIASRVGLWGFDLCVQIIVQEEVEPDNRGSFSSTEASFQNMFELCSYASTLVFFRPEQFRYPVLMSCVATFISGALYAAFVRRRRGHLLHMPRCIPIKEHWHGHHRRSDNIAWQRLPSGGSGLD